MYSLKRAADDRSPVSFHILVPLWGDAYIEKFCDIALPALLADGNLPALARHAPCQVAFLTTLASTAALEINPEIAKLDAICTRCVVLIDDLMSLKEYGIILTLAYGRGISATGARQLDTYFIFLNADFVFSDGLLATVLDRVERGFNAVVCPSLRCNQEDVAPALTLLARDHGGQLSAPPSDLVRLALDALHPTAQASIVNQDAAHSTVANQFFWKVDDDTLVGRFYLMFMLCIRPEVAFSAVTGWCDYVLVPELVPSGNYDVLTDSADGFILELQARSDELALIRKGRILPEEFASRLSMWTTAQHRDYASHDVVFRAGTEPDDIEERRCDLAAYMDSLNGRLTQPPTPFRDHLFWLGSLDWHRRYAIADLPPELTRDDVGAVRRSRFALFGRELKPKSTGVDTAAFARTIRVSATTRQTVLAGPAEAGRPAFLPAQCDGLTLTAERISNTTPLVVSAALGFTLQGARDTEFAFKVAPTWSSLSENSRLYLFVNVFNGEVGSTLAEPAYRFGGPISGASGQFTFDTQAQVGYLGNGVNASPMPLVFLGEVLTDADRIIEATAYAYGGRWESDFEAGIPSDVVRRHDLGFEPAWARCLLRNIEPDLGYEPGETIGCGDGMVGGLPIRGSRLYLKVPPLLEFCLPHAQLGVPEAVTPSRWEFKLSAGRDW